MKEKTLTNQLNVKDNTTNEGHPLDSRSKVSSLDDLALMSGAYVGLHIYVEDRQTEYVVTKLNGTDIDMEQGLVTLEEFVNSNPNAVLYTAQTLTNNQKAQARQNIGAGTGDYTDLVNKPIIPVKVSDLENDSGFITMENMSTKQDTLVSGTNIKTINNQSILGSGNITIQGGSGGTSDYTDLTNKPSINGVELRGNKTTSDLKITIPTKTSDLTNDSGFLTSETEPAFNSSPAKDITDTDISNWNDKVSATNVASQIYGTNASGEQRTYQLSSGTTAASIPLRESGGALSVGTPTIDAHAATKKYVNDNLATKQDTLVSGTNIKTINNQSILGSGNIDIEGYFLGWFDNLTSLNAEHSNPVVGNYAYVKGATLSDPVKIYECTTAGTWNDSGRTVDTSNVQSFLTGEQLNTVGIGNQLTDDTDNLIKGRGIAAYINSKTASLPYIESSQSSFEITDEAGYAIARFEGGELETQNFKSINTPYQDNLDEYPFEISDEQGNTILRVRNDRSVVISGFDSSNLNPSSSEHINPANTSIAAFVDKMNEYATEFGMNNTHFLNASGQNVSGHYSTAKDIMRMCSCCTAYEKLMRFWGLETYTSHVYGSHERNITVQSTYKGSSVVPAIDYHIYGGKSGSWSVGGTLGYIRNLTLVVKSKVDNTWLVGCVLQSLNTDRSVPFEQLLDWLESYRSNPSIAEPTIEADYAAAGIVPSNSPMAYADVDYCLVSKNGDTSCIPASTTKLMTAMITLDYCSLDEFLTIEQNDIQSGSGPTFYAGDKISIRNAIPTLLLPSSNTLAVALSRYVGNKIINIKNK